MTRPDFYVLTGASGGGKSTLLKELRGRGHACVDEPGRKIVREQLDAGGDALPWGDVIAFRDLLLERSIEAYDAALECMGPVFFDRGVPEAIGYSKRIGDPLAGAALAAAEARRYGAQVFAVPPWREIYRNDGERRKSWAGVLEDHTATVDAYRALGYAVIEIPKTTVSARADFVVETIRARR